MLQAGVQFVIDEADMQCESDIVTYNLAYNIDIVETLLYFNDIYTCLYLNGKYELNMGEHFQQFCIFLILSQYSLVTLMRFCWPT